MNLPESQKLPVNLLAACFNHKVATYKYYWLLSIIELLEEGNQKVFKNQLFSRMVSNAWYTVNYFHLSFGKQDSIQDAIKELVKIESISIDEKKERIFEKLFTSINSETNRTLWRFNKNVPHWFLSTWFPKRINETEAQQRRRIYLQSKTLDEKCLYALHEDSIIINPDWKDYLVDNSGILKDFCYWNLALFLQSRNPNVPDIPNKLIKPARRPGLIKQRTHFWDLVINELGSIKCIYTDETLTLGNYSVEHFIPYNFVSHDLIWNLIPSDKSFNSSKSDKLPPIEKFFDPFFALQKQAMEIVKFKNPSNKLLQDYLTIFPDLDISFSKEKFREVVQPLITIASNNGCEFLA